MQQHGRVAVVEKTLALAVACGYKGQLHMNSVPLAGEWPAPEMVHQQAHVRTVNLLTRLVVLGALDLSVCTTSGNTLCAHV